MVAAAATANKTLTPTEPTSDLATPTKTGRGKGKAKLAAAAAAASGVDGQITSPDPGEAKPKGKRTPKNSKKGAAAATTPGQDTATEQSPTTASSVVPVPISLTSQNSMPMYGQQTPQQQQQQQRPPSQGGVYMSSASASPVTLNRQPMYNGPQLSASPASIIYNGQSGVSGVGVVGVGSTATQYNPQQFGVVNQPQMGLPSYQNAAQQPGLGNA